MKAANVLRNHKGSVAVDTSASLIIISAALVICISVVGAMIQGISLNSAATDVKRLIETDGKYDVAEQQKVSTFLSKLHVSATVSVDPQEDVYELGDTFIVTLKQNTSIGATGLSVLPITLTGRAGGSCEVYRK